MKYPFIAVVMLLLKPFATERVNVSALNTGKTPLEVVVSIDEVKYCSAGPPGDLYRMDIVLSTRYTNISKMPLRISLRTDYISAQYVALSLDDMNSKKYVYHPQISVFFADDGEYLLGEDKNAEHRVLLNTGDSADEKKTTGIFVSREDSPLIVGTIGSGSYKLMLQFTIKTFDGRPHPMPDWTSALSNVVGFSVPVHPDLEECDSKSKQGNQASAP